MDYNLSSLNKEQLNPVLDTEGAILVTAGAGSGKTRLLTHRIAYLITEKNVSPYNILAITFTNKAAKEMADRLFDMTADSQYVWVSTFHSMCAKMLRRYAQNIGYTQSFSIYAEAEKEKIIATIVAEHNTEEDDDLKKTAIIHISNAKNLGLTPSEYLRDYAQVSDIEKICEIYDEYQKTLKNNNAMDFDDLLIKTKELLVTCDEAREHYSNKFKYIHVDEFQDTNTIQYELIKLLAAKHRNVCAVGDEDQCIYGWRGANIENIQNYIADFNCKVYKLEQNYRSTKKILDLANMLIANNTSRIEKKLWTSNEQGVNVEHYVANSDGDEADFVTQTIYALSKRCGYKLSDFAVLMRINALTRSFEQRFMQYGIAHKIYGGFKFYDRKEIKDLLAYFRIVSNHYDNEAIARVINFPKRGIGASSLASLERIANDSGRALYNVIMDVESLDVSSSLKKKVLPFAVVLRCLEEQKDKRELSDLMRYLILMLDLKSVYKEDTEENANRKANINELLSSIKEYTNVNPNATLEDYMQTVTLWTDLDDAPTNDCVNIATVHSAKGLEFKVVFVVGMEDGLFPVSRAETKAEIEEERRLFYVAITRAEQRLYITRTRSRYLYGKIKDSLPSRFLTEVGFERKKERVDLEKREKKSFYDNYGYDNEYDDYPRARTQRTEYKRADNRPTRQNSDVSGFRVGQTVKHRKFGLGKIITLSGSGISLSALIEFEGYGKMNIALAYAPITAED
ncbi:MAG: UvrD-helicase domain-containing protein [Clostridia bacterium]|nr:UvrD-helicase domain-containing protein [Clostridia bacterium]